MKVLVTGATGHLGGHVVEALLKETEAANIAISVRDASKEKAVEYKEKGIDVRVGDFDKPETLETAFAGIDRLLIVSTDGDNETRIRQHGNAVEAAKKAGVNRILYTSVVNAQDSELFLAVVHKTTENLIKETGISYTILRNNWYLENELASIQGVQAGAPWVTSAGEGKVGWAPRKAYAQAAAKALLEETQGNHIYELSGDLLTQAELAQAVGNVLGLTVEVKQVDDETYGKIMADAGVPEGVVPMLVTIQEDIRKGTLAVEGNGFDHFPGVKPASIEAAIKEIL